MISRSLATKRGWDDPYTRHLHAVANRAAWARRKAMQPKPATPVWNTFACPCGAECVGTVTGPELCSNCRAERIV